MSEANRRSFLKSSTLCAPGTAVWMASPEAAQAGSMSAKPNRRETFKLVRDIPIEAGYDLVVAGGGPAGTAAAVCAARLGAKVLLLEATGCLGGMGTSGLVTAFNPMADGQRMLVGGLMREIVTTMHQRGFLAPHVTAGFYSKKFHCWTPFRVEGYKLVLDEMVIAAGVEVRFFTRLVDVDIDARNRLVRGVIAQNVEGFQYLQAKTFIDGTGDAVLADLCGVPYREAGRDTADIMPPTLCAIAGNIDWSQAKKGPEDTGPANQQTLIEKAIADGHFSSKDRHVPGLFQVGQALGMLNTGHIFKMNAVKCRSLSDGMMKGRRLVQEFLAFYRKYVPGCQNMELAATGSLMGVRESRRILGEYQLSFDDLAARRQFPDQIGVFNNSVDIHVYDDSEAQYQRYYQEFTQSGRLKPGECYGLPYGIIVPRGWRNLWVAGRSNSSDIRVSGTIRVQPAASMMGQAAGTAAVQSMATGKPAFDLDTRKLIETLRQAGAYLPQEKLSPTMTRGTAKPDA